MAEDIMAHKCTRQQQQRYVKTTELIVKLSKLCDSLGTVVFSHQVCFFETTFTRGTGIGEMESCHKGSNPPSLTSPVFPSKL